MPVDPPRFLLPPRLTDRYFPYAHSPWHQGGLWVPYGGGRVRLQVSVPWIGDPGDRRHRLSFVLAWQRPLHLPAPSKLSTVVADALRGAHPQRTRGPGLDRFCLKLESWRGEAFTEKKDRALLPHVPRADACLCVREALAWASRLLSHRWPSYHYKLGWIYSAHRFTALLVADEIAARYFEEPASLGDISRLQSALPQLCRRLGEAYRLPECPPQMTPRRLALALVDHVLGPLFLRPLLDPDRCVSLEEGRLWEQAFPPEYRSRLKTLLPAESVHALLSWPKWKREEDQAVNWFVTWWYLLLLVQGPFVRGRWSADEASPITGAGSKLLAYPGVEKWAAFVWDALYT